MTWKNRIGKLPPASYYAQIMAYLSHAYPEAVISKETLGALKPTWDALWQKGRSAEIVAKSTCSCDGRHITLSPALPLHLPKGAYRAPAKADRGQLFEPDQMRESVGIERVKRQAGVLEAQMATLSDKAQRLEARAARARTPEGRAQLVAEFQTRMAALARKREEVAQLGSQLTALRAQLGTVKRDAAQTPRAEATPAPPAAAQKKPEPAAKRTPQAPKKDKATKHDKDQILLSAITAALPDIANKLAAQRKAG